MFSTANQETQLCSSIVTADDNIVEDTASFSLQLAPVSQNERIIIEPSVADITVDDNDSMLEDLYD